MKPTLHCARRLVLLTLASTLNGIRTGAVDSSVRLAARQITLAPLPRACRRRSCRYCATSARRVDSSIA
jgi:hypothetical protein